MMVDGERIAVLLRRIGGVSDYEASISIEYSLTSIQSRYPPHYTITRWCSMELSRSAQSQLSSRKSNTPQTQNQEARTLIDVTTLPKGLMIIQAGL